MIPIDPPLLPEDVSLLHAAKKANFKFAYIVGGIVLSIVYAERFLPENNAPEYIYYIDDILNWLKERE